jgi:putative ABC transport system permease protein
MTQIALSLSSVIAIGTIIGGILGSIYTNTVSGLLLSSLGINNCHFIINYPYLIFLVIGITIISFVISSLVAFRIRKITPYNLLTD